MPTTLCLYNSRLKFPSSHHGYLMSDFFAPLFDWLTLHPHWLGASVFLIILIECMALIGVLWPGVVLVFSAALLAGQAGLALWPLYLLAWLAAMLGNSGSYLLGIRLQAGARSLPLLRKYPHWLARAEIHLSRYGTGSLLAGHFIGPLRPVLPLLAGMLKMPAKRFFIVNMLAAGIWSFTAILPGWLTGAALGSAPPDQFWSQAGLLAAGFGLLAATAFWFGRRPHPQRFTCLALLSGLLLALLLTFWPMLAVFDRYLQQLTLASSSPVLDPILLVFTQFGDVKLQIVLDALLCILLLAYRAFPALVFAAGSLLGSTVLNAGLKSLVGRTRPELLPQLLDGYSMPSGHSVRSYTFCLVIAILLGLGQRRQVRAALLSLALLPASLVAFSRIYLTAHWPTDVLSGALLAVFSCTVMLALLGRQQPAHALPRPFWLTQAGLSLGIFILFAVWSFSTAATRYNLL